MLHESQLSSFRTESGVGKVVRCHNIVFGGNGDNYEIR